MKDAGYIRLDAHEAALAEAKTSLSEAEACIDQLAQEGRQMLHALKLARECFAPGNRLCRQFDELIARMEESGWTE